MQKFLIFSSFFVKNYDWWDFIQSIKFCIKLIIFFKDVFFTTFLNIKSEYSWLTQLAPWCSGYHSGLWIIIQLFNGFCMDSLCAVCKGGNPATRVRISVGPVQNFFFYFFFNFYSKIFFFFVLQAEIIEIKINDTRWHEWCCTCISFEDDDDDDDIIRMIEITVKYNCTKRFLFLFLWIVDCCNYLLLIIIIIR